MSASQSSLDEATVFFELFLNSDWASCHVRGDAIEMFVSRQAGHANPMLGIVESQATLAVEEALLTAPHIGTLVDLVAIGSSVTAGERYGTIELLGEPIELIADRAGTIVRHIGKAGALVQYEEALATFH